MTWQKNTGDRARETIASRWPELSARLRGVSEYKGLALYDQGRYMSVVAEGLRLASAWDPIAEANLQLSSIPRGAGNATVFGVGMGYLPLTALETRAKLKKLVVVPLNFNLFNTMLDHIDMMPWISHPKVQLVSPESVVDLPENFAVTTPMLQLAERKAESLRDHLRQHLAQDHVVAFQRGRESLISNNINRNKLTGENDDDVQKIFNSASPGQSVVVIGAGPSLDHCFEQVRELQHDGAMVVAVDAALKVLLHREIVPDYVVAIDPLDSIREFLDVKRCVIQECGLVYFPSADHQAVADWPGARYRATGTHKRFDSFRQDLSSSVLFSSGGVIHPATDLAVRTGTEHIYFAGADFCYPLEHSHASGVSVTQPSSSVAGAGYTVRDYKGNAIPSSHNLISYYRDLEQYINKMAPAQVRFTNLGLMSAEIKGVQAISVGEAYAA